MQAEQPYRIFSEKHATFLYQQTTYDEKDTTPNRNGVTHDSFTFSSFSLISKFKFRVESYEKCAFIKK